MFFEHRSKPLLPRADYYLRVLRYAGFSIFLIIVSLGIGVVGYHYLNDLEGDKKRLLVLFAAPSSRVLIVDC